MPTGSLLAVDPSLRTAGAALFVDGVLVDSKTIKAATGKDGVGQRCYKMASAIVDWLGHKPIDCVVIEWPWIYPGNRGNNRPNDLMGLAGVGMAVAGMVAPGVVLSPTPAEWIGQLPKSRSARNVMNSPRAKRIFSRLSLEEKSKVEKTHDAIDAIGLGLWALGRLERVKILAGSS